MDEILATIRRIITEDEHAGAPSTGSAAASGPDGGAADDKAADSDDVLELTEAINEDGSTRHLAPIGGSSRQAAGIREPPPLASRPEPGPGPEAGPRRREAPSLRLAPRLTATVDERLVSDVVGAAAAAALRRDGAVPLGARTLEDIVGDLLRPLLRTWLDENLPPIVERLVQAEIARVAREAGSA